MYIQKVKVHNRRNIIHSQVLISQYILTYMATCSVFENGNKKYKTTSMIAFHYKFAQTKLKLKNYKKTKTII